MKKYLQLIALVALLAVPWAVNAQFCTPNPSSKDGSGITNVTFGNGSETVNSSVTWSSAPFYNDYSSQIGAVAAGTSVNMSITYATGYTYGTIIWVDWNGDSTFAGTEVVWVGTSANSNPTTLAVSFDIPTTQDTGAFLMRICAADMAFDDYTGSIAAAAAANPCDSYSWGVALDYTLRVTEAPSCLRPETLTATGITSDGMTLEWVDTLNSGVSYNIAYWKNGGDTTYVTSTTTSYSFIGLDANSMYNFIVTAACSSTDESLPLSGNFRTACGGSTCDLTLELGSTSSYSSPFTYYSGAASVELFQGGASLGAYSSTTTVEVCGTDTIVVKYNRSGYTYGDYYEDMANITIRDGGGVAVYSGSWGDTLCTIATPCPTCIPPTALFVDSVDQENITIGWTPRSGATLFAVYIGDSVVSQSVTDTFYTFTGLTLNTLYNLGVQAICSSDDTSNIATLAARTACGAMTLPFSDNFDSYDNGYFPPCWHRVINYGTDPSVNDQYHASGTQSMFLLAVNDTNLFVTPDVIPTAGNNIYVRYNAFLNWASYYTETKWIKAGVMTDTSDMSTFIALDSVEYHNFNDVFEEREFNTATLDASASYWVAWMFYSTNNGYNTNRGAVDDVYISEMPACLHVDNIVVDTTTADGATIHWSATPDETSFFIRVGNTVYNASDTVYTITGLAARTMYTVFVAANCSGDTSDWVSTTFVTGCASGECDVTVDMVDSYGDGWNGNAIEVYQNSAFVGSATLASGSTGSASISVCSGMPVEFRFHQGSYASEVSFTIYDGGDEVLYTAAAGSMSNVSTGTVLDSVGNACPSCLTPANVIPSVVDSNEITFVWTAEAGYTYLISFDNSAYTVNNMGYYTAYGLVSNTLHTFAVKTICDVGDTSNPRIISVKTACGEMGIPYNESFEGDTEGDVPSCWTVVSDGYNDYPAVDDNGHTGSHSLTFVSTSSNTAMIASSRIPLPGDSIKVTFWAYDYYNYGTLEAGVMTNPYVDSTFTSLITVNSGSYALYEFNTNTMSHDSSYYLAFRYTNSSSYYYAKVDDINISLDLGCMTPTNVSATPDATSPSVVVTWSNGGALNDFVVQYRVSGATAWSAPQYATTTTKTFSGLNYSTTYEFRVGQLCGSDTLWAAPVYATTICGMTPIPYVEMFDSPTGTLPPCWDYTNATYFHWNRWTTHAETSGDGEMMVGSGSAGEAAILPSLNAPFIKLQITFKAKLGNLSEGDGIMMGAYDETTSTVEWLDTLTNPGQSRENFTFFSYNYLGYTGTATRIAIGHSHNNPSDWGFAIDSIVVIELASCNPPENPTAHNTMYPNTADDVFFTWDVSTSGLYVPSQWQVYIDTITSTTPIDSVPESQLITVDTTYYMPPVNTLAEGAHYRFFVRSTCGLNHSNWVEMQNGFATDEFWMNNAATFDTIVGCNFIIYDNGGPVAGYLHNSNSNLIIQAGETGRELQLQGAFFSHGDDVNTFTVYDGIGTTGTVLYSRNTTSTTETIDSVLATTTTGAMTITFTSGYYAALGYELYIHCVGEASCTKPTNLDVEMIGPGTAYATWDSTGASLYRVYHHVSGDSVWNMNPTYTNSITLNGLPTDVVYDFYVVAYCSTTDTSAHSIIRHFNTHYVAPCHTPENLQVTVVDENSASLSWSSTGTMWDVVIVGGATVRTSSNPYVFTGLTANTEYCVRVRNVCDTIEGNYSEWSDTICFTSQTLYTITVASNNDAWGTVSGGGNYPAGATATLVASANNGYHFVQWQDGDTAASRNVIVTGDATYTATFADNNGIEDVVNGNVTLFPNPASTTVTIGGVEAGSLITVVDVNGRTISQFQSQNSELTINMNGYAKGAYFVRITGERSTAIRKLIVK